MLRAKMPHKEMVDEILWCFAQGMSREEAAKRLGYKSKSGLEQVITRERRYSAKIGVASRL